MRIINYVALLERLGKYALRAVSASVHPLLLLHYVMKRSDIPTSDKFLIFSTRSYLLLPVNLIDTICLPVI